MQIKHLALVASVALLGAISPAKADTNKDFQTISKAISFISGGPTGDVAVDVLYDSSNADSAAHADEVVALLSGGVGSKVKLTGKKISAPSSISAPVIFITRGANAHYSSALATAVSKGALTVSTDEACLGSGCVMVVKTQPSIEILVSTNAASQTGTEFASAFSMMIKQR